MVSVAHVAPKAKQSLFSLRKATATGSQQGSQTNGDTAQTGTVSQDVQCSTPSYTRPPMVPRSSSSSWVDSSSPPSSPPCQEKAKTNQAGIDYQPHDKEHSACYQPSAAPSPSPSSVDFRFPAQPEVGKMLQATATTGAKDSSRRPRSRSSPMDRTQELRNQHSKTRSHFSIPDVMVTAAEEDGEEVYFEVEVPADDRRMKLHNAPQKINEQSQDHPNAASAANDVEDVQHPTVSRKSFSDKIRPFLRKESSEKEKREIPQVPSVPEQTTQAAAPASSSSSNSRTAKGTISVLFGKKNKKVGQAPIVTAFPQADVGVDLPQRSTSPYGQSGSAFDSSGSLPLLSSKDSLPSSSGSHHQPRTPPATQSAFPPTKPNVDKAVKAPPAPFGVPVASTAAVPRSAAKKQVQARQKEEVALIKELAKVDKMVRDHDAKEQKKQAKLSNAKPIAPPFKMMTIFSAGRKSSTPVRKASVAKRTASTARREHGQNIAGNRSSPSSSAAWNHSQAQQPADEQEDTRFSSSPSIRKRSDESDERSSFVGADWSAALPTTGLTSLAGKAALRFHHLPADETLDSTTSSDTEMIDSSRFVGPTMPREDSAVMPLVRTVDEENHEEESVSPSSTWSSDLHRGTDGPSEDEQTKQGGMRNKSELPRASPAPETIVSKSSSPPSGGQTSCPSLNDGKGDEATANAAEATTTKMKKKSRSPPLYHDSPNASPSAQAHTATSFEVGQIIPGLNSTEPVTRRASKAKTSGSGGVVGGGGGGRGGDNRSASPSQHTQYAPFRAVMMNAGPTAMQLERAGQPA